LTGSSTDFTAPIPPSQLSMYRVPPISYVTEVTARCPLTYWIA
jgi:hypothetical protein